MIRGKRKRRDRVTIEFSIRELIDMRRYLNRAVVCCQGECHKNGPHGAFGKMPAWYYVEPLIKKIDKATTESDSELGASLAAKTAA